MAVEEALIAKLLARSARHCCVCRRFLPLSIIVHHIVERSDGGTDDEDNLIPICVNCHAAVHTKTKLARGFTPTELKLCRDAVYSMVQEGKLPAGEPPSMIESSALESLISALSQQPHELPKECVQILLAAVCEQANIVVEVIGELRSSGDYAVRTGNQRFYFFLDKKPKQKNPISTLRTDGYITEIEKDVFALTDKGNAYVEKIVQTAATFTLKKIQCMECNLHFMICTDFPDAHQSENLTCPECGQHNGLFLIWSQKQFGFIFQQVPGNAVEYEIPASVIDYVHARRQQE